MADYWDEHSREADNGSEDMIDFIRQLNTGKNMYIFKTYFCEELRKNMTKSSLNFRY